ncbi:PREDICTED: uncharacterized protein LOC105567789 [Vollenhovia emeryi]|uniref:uncharacterized protein LOC105567789 n=1 Tax=Vollenhovia emeryi TaxID=411798 RepID=UPI0005F4B634|nr:PREDICTED: uncharacterized protein LOC105567789 [Vollenhovia emeryi]
MEYLNEEYCDMFLIYGEYGQNSEMAAREYARRFPHRRAPYPRVFTRLINRVRQTGSVMPNRQDDGAGRYYEAYSVENEEAVLACFNEDPCTSIRMISRTLNLSKTTVHRILKNNIVTPVLRCDALGVRASRGLKSRRFKRSVAKDRCAVVDY